MISLSGYHYTLGNILAVIFGFGLLIFVHELGHFLMAKKFKVKVEEFAFGFGLKIFGFKYGETLYSLRAIPFGGMVKMPGEDIDSATGSADEFLSQPWYKKLLIALFGPLMNYLLAVLLFAGLFITVGVPRPSSRPVIGEVLAEKPAARAGLKNGDEIVQINRVPVDSWESVVRIIHNLAEKNVELTVRRQQVLYNFKLKTIRDPVSGYGLIGITPLIVEEKLPAFKALIGGFNAAVFQSVFTIQYLVNKIRTRATPEIAGPIGVVSVLAKAARSSLADIVYVLGVISTALGLFNLFPIPLLDGGHILLSLLEGIIRRPLDKKMVRLANLLGLSIIIGIFLFATYSDIMRLIFGVNKIGQ